MKYFIIVFFVLLNFTLQAQTESDSIKQYKRIKKNETFEQKFIETQKNLDLSIKLFQEVEQTDKNLLRAKCKSYLFQLFDLSIEKRENEIVQLQLELERIGKRDQNIDKFNDLIVIKEEIELVQNEIFKRKKNRDKIVDSRLKELLP